MDRVDTVVACVTSEDSVNRELLEQLRRELAAAAGGGLEKLPDGGGRTRVWTRCWASWPPCAPLEMPTTQEAARLSA